MTSQSDTSLPKEGVISKPETQVEPLKRQGKRHQDPTCAYCGGPAMTRDHVPPKGFFPEPFPPNLLTVPSCAGCNSPFAVDEEYTRNVLASGWQGSADQLGYRVFSEKVMAAARRRNPILFALRQAVFRQEITTASGLYLGSQAMITLDPKRINRVISKICRGLFYHETKKAMPARADVFIVPNPENVFLPEDHLAFLQSLEVKGPCPEVFQYRCAMDEANCYNSVWWMQFYHGATFLVTTGPGQSGTT